MVISVCCCVGVTLWCMCSRLVFSRVDLQMPSRTTRLLCRPRREEATTRPWRVRPPGGAPKPSLSFTLSRITLLWALSKVGLDLPPIRKHSPVSNTNTRALLTERTNVLNACSSSTLTHPRICLCKVCARACAMTEVVTDWLAWNTFAWSSTTAYSAFFLTRSFSLLLCGEVLLFLFWIGLQILNEKNWWNKILCRWMNDW